MLGSSDDPFCSRTHIERGFTAQFRLSTNGKAQNVTHNRRWTVSKLFANTTLKL